MRSITTGRDTLAYPTVSGGLFFFRLQDSSGDRAIYFLIQETIFKSLPNLYEYPLAMNENVLVISVANKAFVYTPGRGRQQRQRVEAGVAGPAERRRLCRVRWCVRVALRRPPPPHDEEGGERP